MPKMKLQSFIEQVKHQNESSKKVSLSIKTRKGFKSFIDALNDPDNKGVQSITELDLSASNLSMDKIRMLVAALNKHSGIKTLHLNNCKITDELSCELVKLEHVLSLSLKDNLLKNRPMFSTKLEALYLDNNPKLSAKQVLHYLNTYTRNLQTLSMANCNVKDIAFRVLNANRSIFPKLTSLNLRDNHISFVGVNDLVSVKTLTTLDLGNNRYIGSDGIHLLKGLDKLETLYVDSCNVSLPGLVHIAEMNLQTVDLSFNALLANPWEQNFEDIAPNHSVQTMKLMFCGLSDAHVKTLNKSFPETRTLVVANNKLTPKGVVSLLENPHLQSLDVGTHQLYKKPALRGNKAKLQALISAEKEKMEPMLEAIRRAPDLTDIHLEGTGLSSKMLLSLIPASGDNGRKLKKINGIPCKKLKRTLEQEIQLKREAKESSTEVVLSELSASPREEIVPQSNLTRKDKRIKQLEAENASLKEALAAAQVEIGRLKSKSSADILTSGKSVRNIVSEFESLPIATTFFAPKKAASVKVKKPTSESVDQPTSGSSTALN